MSYMDETGLKHFSSIVKDDIETKANIDSPVFTGIPEAPTPKSGAIDTQITTVGYVDNIEETISKDIDEIQSIADNASTIANEAQTTAKNAQTSANSAISIAEDAQRDAKDALDTINDVYTVAESAQTTANEAKSTISSIQNDVESAINIANEASNTATSTLETAEAALDTVNNVIGTIDNIRLSVETALSASESAQAASNEALTKANDTYDIANEALSSATYALNTVDSVSDIANAAQTAAGEAQSTADEAMVTAESAQSTANEIQSSVEQAIETSTAAQVTAENAESIANSALYSSDENATNISNLTTDVNKIKSYELVGSVDLNTYIEYAKIFINSDSDNAPTNVENCFVDVSVTDDMSMIRQIATGYSTGTVYIRNSVVSSDFELGRVIIEGDLNYDLKVDGNLVVNGNILGDVSATGSIEYNGLSGEANEYATLDSYDISIHNGTLTFYDNVYSNGNVLYTTGNLINDYTATTTIYCDLTVNTNSRNAIENIDNSELIIEKDSSTTAITTYNDSTTTGKGIYNSDGSTIIVKCLLTVTAEGSNCYGIHNNNSDIKVYSTGKVVSTGGLRGISNNGDSTVIVNGELTTTGKESSDSYGLYNMSTVTTNNLIYAYSNNDPVGGSGVIDGHGKLYANDSLYYEGDGESPNDDDLGSDSDDGDGNGGDSIYWTDWVNAGQTGTVGNSTTLIWLNKGEIVASTSTVGNATTPVYLNYGSITKTNEMVDVSSDQTITGVKTFNGLTITESGHIKLPSGIEFY